MILAYHTEHGDDYGSETAREAKYRAILSLAYFHGKTVLDAGCGSRRFQGWLPSSCTYTGVDLLDGEDIWDYRDPHQIVVANGILYKLLDQDAAWRMVEHLWSLTEETLIFTSLSSWDGAREDELVLNPVWTLLRCINLSRCLTLRHDYLPGDFTVALRR